MKKFITQIRSQIGLKRLLFIVVILLVIGAAYLYEKMTNRIFIDNSQVLGPVVSVSSQAPGLLRELDVYEGQTVNKGDLLAVVGTDALRADTYGLVINAQNQVGGTVSVQNPVIQLVNLSDMRVVGTLDENKGLDQLKIGQPVSFTVDALPNKTFWGYVDEISPSAKQTALSFSISSVA